MPAFDVFQRESAPCCPRAMRSKNGLFWKVESRTVGEDHCAFNQVLELRVVPRPVVCLQSLHCLFTNALDVLAALTGKLIDKVADQQGPVFPPVAQWRQRNWEDIQSIVEVVAK